MKLSIAISVLIVNLACIYCQDLDYCFSTDPDKSQEKKFGTKVPYIEAHGTKKEHFYVENCEPKKIWFMARHGIRYPPGKIIDQLMELVGIRDQVLENFQKYSRGFLCAEDLELLKNWTPGFYITENLGYNLAPQGREELKQIANDFKKTFQSLIDSKYSKDKFRFAYMDNHRCSESYLGFIDGLFGENFNEDIQPFIDVNQTLLRPSETCQLYKNNEKIARGNSSERFKFVRSEIFKISREEISARLGFNYTLSWRNIEAMWDMCRYDHVLTQNPSAWCAAFTYEHVNILEYQEDLFYFGLASFTEKVNTKVMCTTVQDMLKFLESETNPNFSAYFTHGTAIRLFLTALDYGRDNEPLRADNYEKMKTRQFKTSEVTPFAANIAAVKYSCPNKVQKVKFFLNEKPIKFNWCNDGLCDLNDLFHVYREFFNSDCSQIFCKEDEI